MAWKLVYAGMEHDLQKAQLDPFYEGASHFLEGRPIERCPYGIMRYYKARLWKEGWQKASEGKVQLVKVETQNSNESVAQEWNELYPPGTEVHLTNDDGEIEETKTRSIAWLLGSGTPVVLVEGRPGGYLLERIRPR